MPRPPSLSPELLQTFLTVVRTDGNAMKAADQLKINQPSMSKRLALLQHAGRILRRPWLERRGKMWFLTEEGKRVLPAVEEIIHRYRILTEAISDSDRPALNFACGAEYLDGFPRDAVRTWREKFPETKFRIATPRASLRIEGVANGAYDLAVVTQSDEHIYHLAHRPLKIEILFDDPLMMVASSKFSMIGDFEAMPDKKAASKNLTKFPLILPELESALRKDLDNRFRDEEMIDRIQVVMEVANSEGILRFVRDGIGVGIVTQSALVGENLKDLSIRKLPVSLCPDNQVKLISRIRPVTEELDLSPETEEFRQLLKLAAKQWLHG
jgi:DNA-binding transcriptional LysR family regulator